MLTKIVYFLIILILIIVIFIGVRAAVAGIQAKKKIKHSKKFNRNKKNYN
tara:strand:+ start:501 stop:650 length:150 start_codon:yes stop_codon:yes gene_type:complete